MFVFINIAFSSMRCVKISIAMLFFGKCLKDLNNFVLTMYVKWIALLTLIIESENLNRTDLNFS